MYYANHLVELLACNINLKTKRDFTPQLHLTQTKQHAQYVDDTNITDRPEISQFSIQIRTLVAYETIFHLLIKPSSQLDASNIVSSISHEYTFMYLQSVTISHGRSPKLQWG